jgi:AbrB family looped-hinge helix DNA binding protein
MRTTIDPAGRLLIPKEIRQQAGLKPGMALDVHCRAGRIEIERAPLPVSVVKKGRLMVAVPRTKAPPLSAETVERTRRAVRRESPA